MFINKQCLLLRRAADEEVIASHQGMSSCFSRTVLQYRAHKTIIELLRQETRQTLFHRYSGYRMVQILNPVDYKIWAIMQQRIYQTNTRNVGELRQRLLNVWSGVEQDIINHASIDQQRVRLKACVRSVGGHVENML